jgi:hypothetical protein
MGCERYEAELIEAAVGTPASRELERHLAECLACRSRLEGERRLMEDADRSLRAALRVEPSPGFEARLLVAARRDARSRSLFSWPAPVWASALAAGLGFLLVFGWLARRSPRPASSPSQAAVATGAPAPAPRESAPVVETGGTVRGPGSSPRVAAAEPPRDPDGGPVRSRPSRREPEVLVPPGREQALVQFVSMLRDPRVEPPKLLADATDPEAPLPDIEPIKILDLDPKTPSDPVKLDGRSES